MTTIDTDNLVDDFVSNLAAIFEAHQTSLGLNEIYKDDLLTIPIVPSVAVSCTSFFNTKRTIGSNRVRYEFDIIGEIWYYHCSINPDIRRNLVMRNAFKVSQCIIENASLNGWLTNTRALVRSCNYTVRPRSGSVMASARIIVIAPYQLTIDTIV
jgi:hypothetical protein